MKIHSMEAELFHAYKRKEGQIDSQKDMMKLTCGCIWRKFNHKIAEKCKPQLKICYQYKV